MRGAGKVEKGNFVAAEMRGVSLACLEELGMRKVRWWMGVQW